MGAPRSATLPSEEQGRPRAGVAFCVLAPAPFAIGGIERLTGAVVAALEGSSAIERVEVAALIGPGRGFEPSDPYVYVGPSTLSFGAKARFGGWVLRRAMRRPRATFVCMHVAQAPLAMLAKVLFGARYVVWAHGAEVWGRIGLASRRALGAADLVICSSGYTRSAVVRHGVREARVRTRYPCVSGTGLPRARTAVPADRTEPVILSVGRMDLRDAYKGYDQVIRCLPAIRRVVPGVRYEIVGGGRGLPTELQRLAASLGVGDLLTLRGPASEEQLWAAFERARVVAMPSRVRVGGRSVEGEGFGIVFIEAAAFGRPVVGSLEGGAPEAVVHGETGLLVDPRRPEDVAEALLAVLRDPGLARRMGEAGRSRVEDDFTPEAFRRGLQHLLEGAGLVPATPWRSVSGEEPS